MTPRVYRNRSFPIDTILVLPRRIEFQRTTMRLASWSWSPGGRGDKHCGSSPGGDIYRGLRILITPVHPPMQTFTFKTSDFAGQVVCGFH